MVSGGVCTGGENDKGGRGDPWFGCRVIEDFGGSRGRPVREESVEEKEDFVWCHGAIATLLEFGVRMEGEGDEVEGGETCRNDEEGSLPADNPRGREAEGVAK